MLRAVEVANFKAFATHERLRLAPLTLVYGANSSGKTTLLQSLTLLRKSMDSDDVSAVLEPKDALLDLGGYRESVNGHDVDGDVRIGLEVDVEAEDR